MLAAISCIRHSLVLVPLYDTLGADAASHILAHTEASLVVIDTLKRLENVFSMREKTHLKHVLLTNRPEEAKWQEAQQKAVNAGLTLHLMEDLMTQGATQTEQPPDHPPRADDIYIVWFVDSLLESELFRTQLHKWYNRNAKRGGSQSQECGGRHFGNGFNL